MFLIFLYLLSAGSLLATDGEDYTGLLPQEVVFEDGDTTTKIYVISITDDADPELAEQFTVTLSNPPGGTALIDPESVRCKHCILHCT